MGDLPYGAASPAEHCSRLLLWYRLIGSSSGAVRTAASRLPPQLEPRPVLRSQQPPLPAQNQHLRRCQLRFRTLPLLPGTPWPSARVKILSESQVVVAADTRARRHRDSHNNRIRVESACCALVHAPASTSSARTLDMSAPEECSLPRVRIACGGLLHGYQVDNSQYTARRGMWDYNLTTNFEVKPQSHVTTQRILPFHRQNSLQRAGRSRDARAFKAQCLNIFRATGSYPRSFTCKRSSSTPDR